MYRNGFLILLMLIGFAGPVLAASPPDLINFQGVLRDDGDDALDGDHDMEFRFCDTETPGPGTILVDAHKAIGSGAVTVSGGLFNVKLGSGVVTDGTDPGSYTSLAEVLRDYGDVWLEIVVGGEVLTPRVRVVSSAYALNADHLDGIDASGFIDTSASAQTKAGNLTVRDLTVSDNNLYFGGGGLLQDSGTQLQIFGGTAADDDLILTGGSTAEGGRLAIFGGGTFSLRSGSGLFDFRNSANAQIATLTSANLQIAGDLSVAGGDVDLGPGLNDDLTALDVSVLTDGGNADALHSHSSVEDADTLDGNDSSFFLDTSASAQTKAGNLTVGDLTVSDGQLYFSGGGFVQDAETQLQIFGGNAADDDLILTGGNTAASGRLAIFGGGTFSLRSGSGVFDFRNSANNSIARLTGVRLEVEGDLQLSGASATDDDSLFFDSETTESLTWDDSDSRFEFSDELAISSVLRVGGTSAAPLGYNHIGSGGTTAVPGDINNVNDVYVYGDLEVAGLAYVLTMVAGDPSPTPNQSFSSFGEAANKDESAVASTDDVYIASELEVDGTVFVAGDIEGDADLRLIPPDFADVIIGDGVNLVPDVDVEIAAGSLCIDDDGSCVPPVDGHIRAFVFDAAGHSDVAEVYPSDEPLSPGDVVVVDRSADGKVKKSTSPHEMGLVSVVSTAPGIILGGPTDERLSEAGLDPETGPNFGNLLLVPGTYPIVLMGRAPVHVSDENGPISRGDLLTTSSTPGFAMSASEAGGVLGQALEAWPGPGQGTITAWVMPGLSAGDAAFAPTDDTEKPPSVLASATGTDGSPSPGAALGGLAETALSADDDGNVYARSFRPSASELTSLVSVAEKVEPGDVVAIDPERPGLMSLTGEAADSGVFGIVAAEPGLVLGADPPAGEPAQEGDLNADPRGVNSTGDRQQTGSAAVRVPVSVSGVALCKVDAGYGSVRPGDLLTTSPTPGHAMRSDEPRPGTILGKALEPMEFGTGLIKVLVMLR